MTGRGGETEWPIVTISVQKPSPLFRAGIWLLRPMLAGEG
jgi:hypothetical protein